MDRIKEIKNQIANLLMQKKMVELYINRNIDKDENIQKINELGEEIDKLKKQLFDARYEDHLKQIEERRNLK